MLRGWLGIGCRYVDGRRGAARPVVVRWGRALGQWHQDQRGATMLEWTLLLAAIALPAYGIIRLALAALIGQYQMLTMLNGLPFP